MEWVTIYRVLTLAHGTKDDKTKKNGYTGYIGKTDFQLLEGLTDRFLHHTNVHLLSPVVSP